LLLNAYHPAGHVQLMMSTVPGGDVELTGHAVHAVRAPAWLENVPAGHSAHLLSAVFPVPAHGGRYCPAGHAAPVVHGVHASLPRDALYLASSHAEQSPVPYPGRHTHALESNPPGPRVPLLPVHAWHTRGTAPPFPKKPVLHVHAVLPAPDVESAGHGAHAPSAAYVPPRHGAHVPSAAGT
jgi:hypothetical protein